MSQPKKWIKTKARIRVIFSVRLASWHYGSIELCSREVHTRANNICNNLNDLHRYNVKYIDIRWFYCNQMHACFGYLHIGICYLLQTNSQCDQSHEWFTKNQCMFTCWPILTFYYLWATKNSFHSPLKLLTETRRPNRVALIWSFRFQAIDVMIT